MTFTEIPWGTQAGLPLLAALQLLPLLAVVLVWVWRDASRLLQFGILAAGLELLLAVWLYLLYDPATVAMQLAERVVLLGPLTYHAAVDGVSVLFVLLSALLSLLVVVYGPVRGLKPTAPLFMAVFSVEATLMSLFVSLNLLWFTLVSAFQVGLIGYLLWRWATSPDNDRALVSFYQFMGTGVALLLAGTLMLGWQHADASGGLWSFDLFDLVAKPVAAPHQSVIFFLLFYGLAVRTPLFPLHGWLPTMAEHGNIAVAPSLLLGLKVGIYGLLRFVFPVVPEAVGYWSPFVVGFAVVGIFYAALLAMVQDNMRRLLAFAVVSHTGIVVIGLFSLSHIAFQGSVMLSVTFGLAIATLFFMTGLVYRRTRSARLTRMGGLFDHLPFVGIAFLVAGLAIMGMPGTPGFDSVHLVLEAAIDHYGALITIAAALGNVVAAGFLLWAFQRAFLGPLPEGVSSQAVERTSRAELLVAGLVLTVLLGAGFYSEPWIHLIDRPLAGLGQLYGDTDP
jgi:NADH-quinone oxidoreductase subunit M